MHDDRIPVKKVGPDLLAELQYERRDVAQRKLWGWIALFFGGFVASMVITAGIYALFIPNWYKLGQVPAPSPYRKMPPHPQLQVDPRRDMEMFRQAEAKEIRGLEGAIPNTKPAMTIDEAMKKIAGETGIAGVKGTGVATRGTGYPGSRQYGDAPTPMEKTENHAATGEQGTGAHEDHGTGH